jgi:dethiobiotin synthetase
MSVLVVTGTGTNVGKTVVTAGLASLALARGASVAVVKPGQTGVGPEEAGDIDEVHRLAGPGVDGRELARFPDPLAPAAAARRAGQPPYDLRDAVDVVTRMHDHHRLVLVEGSGGLLVRYDEEGATIADLARWLDAACVVVVDPALGALNHTALTLEAMANRGVRLAGIVLGRWPPGPAAGPDGPDLAMRSNVGDLEMLAARPLAGALTDGVGRLTPSQFEVAARRGLGPEFGGTFDAADFRRRAGR